jgi:hypothetical protein
MIPIGLDPPWQSVAKANVSGNLEIVSLGTEKVTVFIPAAPR